MGQNGFATAFTSSLDSNKFVMLFLIQVIYCPSGLKELEEFLRQSLEEFLQGLIEDFFKNFLEKPLMESQNDLMES